MKRWMAGARRLILAGLLVLVLTVASVPLSNLAVYSPARTVTAYFDALADGDAARALGMISAPRLGDDVPRTALTDAVLSAAPAVPTQLQIVSTERAAAGSEAVVRVRFNLGNATHTADLHLERGPAQWGLFDRWHLRFDSWPQLSLQISGAGSVDVNGTAVPTDHGPVPVLFPVAYNIGFNAAYLAADVKQVTVTGPNADVGVALEPKPTPALTAEVKKQVDAHLARCMKAKTLMPAGCTFGYETDNEILGDVTWKLVRAPRVQLRSTGSQLGLVPAAAVAEVSGTYRDAVTAFEFDFREQVPFTLGAEVTVTGDAVQVRPTSGAELAG